MKNVFSILILTARYFIVSVDVKTRAGQMKELLPCLKFFVLLLSTFVETALL